MRRLLPMEYAEYLRRFETLGAKAINKRDYEIYEAVRHLSQLKELEAIDAVALKATEVGSKITAIQNGIF